MRARLTLIGVALAALTVSMSGSVQATPQNGRIPNDPPGTFSILGFDPETGEIGAAVQSRVFAVGNGVIWAEAGVGAVATQAVVDVSYDRNVAKRHDLVILSSNYETADSIASEGDKRTVVTDL